VTQVALADEIKDRRIDELKERIEALEYDMGIIRVLGFCVLSGVGLAVFLHFVIALFKGVIQ
jgi:hypothetical protein